MLQSRYHKCRIIHCSVVTPDGRQTVAEERAGAPAAVYPKETPGLQQTPGAATFAAQVGGAGSHGHTLLSESGHTVGARAARLHHAARATYRTVSRWRPWVLLCPCLSVPGRDSAGTAVDAWGVKCGDGAFCGKSAQLPGWKTLCEVGDVAASHGRAYKRRCWPSSMRFRGLVGSARLDSP